MLRKGWWCCCVCVVLFESVQFCLKACSFSPGPFQTFQQFKNPKRSKISELWKVQAIYIKEIHVQHYFLPLLQELSGSFINITPPHPPLGRAHKRSLRGANEHWRSPVPFPCGVVSLSPMSAFKSLLSWRKPRGQWPSKVTVFSSGNENKYHKTVPAPQKGCFLVVLSFVVLA